LGLVMALLISYIAKWFIRSKEKSFFILELPTYRSPRWNNIAQTMVQKARVFVTEAGKIIMIISLVLWVLSSFGPPSRMDAVERNYQAAKTAQPNNEDIDGEYATAKLENSYAGILGSSIEPAIKPLGFDWRIGIALITSFAAREVFVGTMATLYSVGEDEEGLRLRDKMRAATWPNGAPLFTLAAGLSLMVFYVFAMQCMSTLAITKRETRTWKWPIIQFVYMTTIAYVMSFIVYQIAI
jgi:ferrous iron transport protein B